MSRGKKSPMHIVGLIVMILMFIAILAILAVSYVFKDSNSTPELFGYNIYIMNGTEMEPAIPNKAAVFSRPGPLLDDPIGSVALCNVVDNELTTVLRVAGVEEENGVKVYLMKSDKSSSGTLIKVKADKVVGQALYVSKATGVILSFITSQTGILVLVILPCAILLIIQLVSVLKKINEKDEPDTNSIAYEEDYDYREDNYDSYDESEPSTYTKAIEAPPVIEEKAKLKSEQVISDIKRAEMEVNNRKLDADQKPPLNSYDVITEIKKAEAEAKKSAEKEKQVTQKETEAFKQPPTEQATKTVQAINRENTTAQVKPEPPKVDLDRDGRAEYIKQKPTSDLSALNKVLPPVESQPIKASNSIDNLKKSIEHPSNLPDFLYNSKNKKPISADDESKTAEIKPVKTEASSTPKAEEKGADDVYIAPRPKKTTTNKTLEELMKMLDKKDGKN